MLICLYHPFFKSSGIRNHEYLFVFAGTRRLGHHSRAGKCGRFSNTVPFHPDATKAKASLSQPPLLPRVAMGLSYGPREMSRRWLSCFWKRFSPANTKDRLIKSCFPSLFFLPGTQNFISYLGAVFTQICSQG